MSAVPIEAGLPAADIQERTLRKVSIRLLPLLAVGYGIAYMDRVNVGFAALQMNAELKLSASAYAFGAGIFFLSYALAEVPSNLLLVRFGARRWLARIMATWGLLAMGMMFVRTPTQFYVMRFLLGAAEAGFFPGVVLYLSYWYPPAYRGRAIARFYVASPLAAVVMGGIAAPLLALQGVWGLSGWQWLFLIEGSPAVILSVLVFFVLPDSPQDARWLSDAERRAIVPHASGVARHHGVWQTLGSLRDRRVLLYGIANLCLQGSINTAALLGPLVLRERTGYATATLGLVTAMAYLGSAGAQLVNGWHSDTRRERLFHAVVPILVAMGAWILMATTGSPRLTTAGYMLQVVATGAAVVALWFLPAEEFSGGLGQVGVAAVGSVGMLGAFAAPYLFGVVRDLTGGYTAGLWITSGLLALSAAVLVISRAQRRQATSRATGHG